MARLLAIESFLLFPCMTILSFCQENMPKKVTLRLRVLDEKNGTKGGGF